ncbi:MAG: tetratricopeptide repeat protein [Acidobacteria bacterium]|nr:tetratricopeptide repeat protein [Acidobacteriota bacterium]
MTVLASAIDQKQGLEGEFQAAVAAYDAGHYSEAVLKLENLVQQVPESFEVQELLGLVYTAQSKDKKATEHLKKAVDLNPKSAAARTNLATNLVRLQEFARAEIEFKKALQLEPQGYDASHNLGEFYVTTGRIPEAVPPLENAQRVKPEAYDNGYDLALAYIETERLADARQLILDLLGRNDTAELHDLFAQVEERDGKFLSAEHEYELAAHMEPSESNLFDWGCELLLHRTLDPAIEVFERAAEQYPHSARLAIGLGMALYSRGNYDQAVKALLKAADLGPKDGRAYYFLAKAYSSSPRQADEVIEHFRRFAQLQPENGRAFYYYAMSLWKGRRAQDAKFDVEQIESLLKQSIARDSNLAEAHFELGNLYSDQARYIDAVPEYERTLQLSSDLPDAHYRLGQAYVHTGHKDLAQRELEIYQRLRAEHLAELDKQRAEIRQFVYSEKESQGLKP